jgi:RNA polymerase sigma-70 factor (ECF subfamily)
MTRPEPDTDELLRRAGGGDQDARGALLQRHRDRLRRMIVVHMDRRLAARLDPSDVVQETLAEADRRLDGYLRKRPLPFYPWLRRLAWDRLVEQHRRHLRAGRRSVLREEAEPPRLAEGSVLELADRFFTRSEGPSAVLRRQERVARMRAALDALPERDREVLVLRYLEQLPAEEVAAVLGVSEVATKKRALRALQRLRALLSDDTSGGSR